MSNEIVTYTKTKELFRGQEVKSRFAEVFGNQEEAESFIASVLSVVYQSDSLRDCDPQSIYFASMKAAVLNLPIEPNLGQAYIIPYKGKATFQVGYRGLIQLAHRTENYLALNVAEIYEGEKLRIDRLTGAVKLNGKRTSDRIVGYCGYFKLKNGFEKFYYMTIEQLEEHGKRYSPSYKYDTSLWHTDPDAMYRKTVLKQMLSAYGQLEISKRLSYAVKTDEGEVIESEVRDITKEIDEEEEQKVKETVKKQKKSSEPKKEEVTLPVTTAPEPEVPEPEAPPPPVEELPKIEDDDDAKLVAIGIDHAANLCVNYGYFPSEVMARTALRFYTGNMFWYDIENWAKLVSKHLGNGDTLATAAQKANQ